MMFQADIPGFGARELPGTIAVTDLCIDDIYVCRELSPVPMRVSPIPMGLRISYIPGVLATYT